MPQSALLAQDERAPALVFNAYAINADMSMRKTAR